MGARNLGSFERGHFLVKANRRHDQSGRQRTTGSLAKPKIKVQKRRKSDLLQDGTMAGLLTLMTGQEVGGQAFLKTAGHKSRRSGDQPVEYDGCSSFRRADNESRHGRDFKATDGPEPVQWCQKKGAVFQESFLHNTDLVSIDTVADARSPSGHRFGRK